MKPRPELYRCVLAADSRARIDASAAGRGAWLCGPECLDAAVMRRGFDRAWRATAPTSVGQDLRRAFNGLGLGTSVEDESECMDAGYLGDAGGATHETMLMRAKG